MNSDLLSVRGLVKYFPVSARIFFGARSFVHAVDGVSLTIRAGDTLGIVGESGCGKTTTARLVLQLDKPTAGAVIFRGNDIAQLSGPAHARYRAAVQAVFQNPFSSLDPRMRVGDSIAEPLTAAKRLDRRNVAERVRQMLRIVGMDPAVASNFPHEFSGGQRQRIAIARSLAADPELVVLDEPVTALDVSIRAQILNLLKDLQLRLRLSYILISHNLATVRYLCHDVAVMYLGEIVEQAAAEELFSHPLHPYTKALLSAAMPARPDDPVQPIVLSGDVPSPVAPPSGCRFHTRCPYVFDRCRIEAPDLNAVSPGHPVACHLY